MAYVREIVTDGQPVLRKVAKKVDPREIGEALFQQLIDDMFETMYAAPGVGLAAPQVNVSKRLFVIDVHQDEHPPAVMGTATLRQLKKSHLIEAFQRHCHEVVSHGYVPGMIAPQREVRRRR